MRSADKNNLAGYGRSIINQKECLLNLQKRQKLKDLLITKFMQKYGIKNADLILEEEISKFLQGEKLNDKDLKRLDMKVRKLLNEKISKDKLKEKLTQSLQGISSNEILPKIETSKTIENNTISPKTRNLKPTTIINTEPSMDTLCQKNLSNSLYNPLKTYGNKRMYKKPEEELAELEAEFAKEEKENKNKYKRLDFTEEGDEWSAIAKYNRKLYEEQIKLEKMKDEELKKRNKADLDLQIKQRLKQEYENELKEKEYDKIMKEHQKEMDELDRKKQEEIKKQVLREKESRDEQMRQNYIRKRIEILKEKKFEKNLVKNIKEGIEKEKQKAIEKKKKENEALLRAIKENDLKMKMKKEKEKRDKEEEIKMGEERIKMQMKEDLQREKYYETIKNNGNKMSLKADEILEKLRKDQEEEDKRIQHYYDEKNRLEIDKEKEKEIKKHRDKFELKKYLDMQIEERKKEEDFLKSLDYEQARIWAIDCKKYNEDEKEINKKIREMNKRNMDSVMEQINKKKKGNKKTAMNETEYAMPKIGYEDAYEYDISIIQEELKKPIDEQNILYDACWRVAMEDLMEVLIDESQKLAYASGFDVDIQTPREVIDEYIAILESYLNDDVPFRVFRVFAFMASALNDKKEIFV